MGTSQNHFFPIIFTLLLLMQMSNSSTSALLQGEAKAKATTIIERSLIGSRPPKCEGRCRNCGHCEAIQVPIIPQQGFPRYHFLHKNPIISSYSRSDSLSNYKPMSWKCKCGDNIFNP